MGLRRSEITAIGGAIVFGILLVSTLVFELGKMRGWWG